MSVIGIGREEALMGALHSLSGKLISVEKIHNEFLMKPTEWAIAY